MQPFAIHTATSHSCDTEVTIVLLPPPLLVVADSPWLIVQCGKCSE